jgi:Prealbumin-like fold domain
MAAFNFHQRPVRRWWLLATTLTAAVVFAVVFVAGSGATTAKQQKASRAAAAAVGSCLTPSVLPGSNFEIDTDANLIVNGALPCIDWLAGGTSSAFMPSVLVKHDLPSGKGDDSFGIGTNENTPAPTIVSGSIPPNKSDLSNFGVNVETGTAGGKFLELFWTRVSNPTGTIAMDFELNQQACLGTAATCANNAKANATPVYVTPLRQIGDKLIEYGLANGGTVPTISICNWDGTQWTQPCTVISGPGGTAIGSINTSTIPANQSGGLGILSPLTFGEAAISFSSLFTNNACGGFGSVYLKSRSSDNFTDELKDFIAPQPVSVNDCGSVLVKKTDTNNNLQAGATFTVAPGQNLTGTPATSSTLIDESTVLPANAGYYCLDNIPLDVNGSQHTVTETAAPAGFNIASPASQLVTVNNAATCATRLAAVPIVPDLTFVDTPQLGAIQITKTGKDKNCIGAGNPAGCSASGVRLLSGVAFDISKGGTLVTTSAVTNASGVTCVSGLLPGSDYTVHETAASTPTGYQAAVNATSVTVTANTNCTNSPTLVSMVNVPLTTITVSTSSLAGGGVTASTVQCTPTAATGVTTSNTPQTTNNLVPGTYVCTVVIDP